jgi:hypothetical protein
MTTETHQAILQAAAARARQAGVFAQVHTEGARLTAAARDADAQYRLDILPDGSLWLSLVTADRWLSESIETDLLHTGDKVEELLEDELVELGHQGGPLRVEHFRSEDLLYTFRSPVPSTGPSADHDAQTAATCLLAYEACFHQLGDMGAKPD